MSKCWIPVAKILTIIYGMSWIISCVLEILCGILVKIWDNCFRENNLRFASKDMADNKEGAVDRDTLATENNLNNDAADMFSTNDNSSGISVQQDDKLLLFGKGVETSDQLSNSSFTKFGIGLKTDNLNNPESVSRWSWSAKEGLDADKGNNKAYFTKPNNIDYFKPTLNKINYDQPNISDGDVSPYNQFVNIKCNETDDIKKWPLVYLDEFNATNITRIEWKDNPEVRHSTSASVGIKTGGVVGGKKSGISGMHILIKPSDTYNSDLIDLISWETPDETSEIQENQKENKEISEKYDQLNRNLLEEIDENIKRDKNKKYQTNIFDATKGSAPIDLITGEIPDVKSKFEVNQKENKEISEKFDQKNENLLENIRDGIINESNSIIYEKSYNEPRDKANMNSKQLTEDLESQMLCEKKVSGSCDAEKNMHSYDLKEDNLSENYLTSSQKDFIYKIPPKPPRLEKVRDDLFHKTPSKRFITVEGYDLEKTESEELGKEGNNNNKIHKPVAMLFGFCSECEPVQSKKTIGKTHAERRISSKGSLSHVSNGNKSHTIKPRSTVRKRLEQQNTSKKSDKTYTDDITMFLYDPGSITLDQLNALENPDETTEKRVTFAEDISIYSYDPEDNILETFYDCTEAEKKEQDDRNEVTKAPEKASGAMKGDAANEKIKEASLKIPKILTKIGKKATKIKDTSTKAPLDIQETSTETKEPPLNNVKEAIFYDNLGFIDDCMPSCSFEADLKDSAKPSISFEKVESLSGNSSLVDSKDKTFCKKISNMTRHTEDKVKKWFLGNSVRYKRLSSEQ